MGMGWYGMVLYIVKGRTPIVHVCDCVKRRVGVLACGWGDCDGWLAMAKMLSPVMRTVRTYMYFSLITLSWNVSKPLPHRLLEYCYVPFRVWWVVSVSCTIGSAPDQRRTRCAYQPLECHAHTR